MPPDQTLLAGIDYQRLTDTDAGQAALPGGKCDSINESPFETARREANEEIGLPLDDSGLPSSFGVEHLCELPTNLARTELGVRPCVAFLSTSAPDGGPSNSPSTSPSSSNRRNVEETLIPRLDAKEVAAVFSAPFRAFLSLELPDRQPKPMSEPAKPWYEGTWTNWNERKWRMHNFFVPVEPRLVTWSRDGHGEVPEERSEQTGVDESSVTSKAPNKDSMSHIAQTEHPTDVVRPSGTSSSHFRVFGMTARILVDAARLAYDEEPEFEHNFHIGDEEMIVRLIRLGRMGPIRKKGEELTADVLAAAAKM